MDQPPDPDALPQPSAGLVLGEERRPRGPRRPPRPREPRPDHFLALRLSHSPSVTSAIAAVQASITEHSPNLAPAIVDPASAHITLGVLSLPDTSAREAAASVLRTAAAGAAREVAAAAAAAGGTGAPASGEAAGLDEALKLTLRGVGNFKNEVVWLGVGNDGGGDAALAVLAAAVRGRFQDAGLLLQADREFVPHVTVAKLSKMQPWNNSGGGRGPRWKRRRGQGCGGDGREAATEGDCDASNSSFPVTEDASEAASAAEIAEDASGAAAAGAPSTEPSLSKPARLIISPESYAPQIDVSASVEVAEVQLCAMGGRRPGQYYIVVASCSLLASHLDAQGVDEPTEAMEDAGEAAATAGDGT